MIIGFDIQALQTENSRDRGIGRYTQKLVSHLTSGPGRADKYVMFYNTRYDAPDIDRQANIELYPIQYKTESAQNLVQYMTYAGQNLDLLHIHSPFEGHPSRLPVINPYMSRLNCAVCTTVYDLIPLHMKQYLEDPAFEHAYYRQLKTLYDCDFILAISENTRYDIINRLGISPDAITNIGGAPAGHFYRLDDRQNSEYARLQKRLGIKERFVLYTGGIDARKNIEESMAAFSKLPPEILADTSYVIVCRISEPDRRRLLELAREHGIKQNIILAGYIPDGDLNILYNFCTVYMFPSLMEGFGLPITEAMACGAPVIASNTSCIPELVRDDRFLFDPYDTDDMARLLSKILADEALRQESIRHSLEAARLYSWDTVAKHAYDRYVASPAPRTPAIKRPRVALFAPLPPTKSGIADYAAFMLPFWSRFWDVDLFVDSHTCSDPYVTTNYSIHSHDDFESMHTDKKYDIILYHFGNSEYHSYMFEMLYRFGGMIILHDIYLSGIIHWMTAAKGNLKGFEDEVEYSHAEEGKKMFERARRGTIPWDRLIWDLPMNRRVIESASHVIVHSDWDRNIILESYPECAPKVSVVPHFCRPLFYSNKEKYKEKLELGGKFLICTFGFIVATKKLADILAGLRDALRHYPDWQYVMVGDTADPHAADIRNIIDKHGMSGQVTITGFVDDLLYQDYLRACDIAVQLRQDIRGGGSGTISRALGAGIPTIVSDIGPFAEMPDDIVIKLVPGSEKDLGGIVSDLYRNPEKRLGLGRAARHHATSNLSCLDCARMHADVISKAGDTT